MTIASKNKSETLAVVELEDPEQAAPVLKKYLLQDDYVRSYFEVDKNDPVEDFVAIAPNHPVFRLEALE